MSRAVLSVVVMTIFGIYVAEIDGADACAERCGARDGGGVGNLQCPPDKTCPVTFSVHAGEGGIPA